MPTLIKNKGLATYHNELGLTEGSLITADNVVIDRNDTVRPRRGLSNYGTAVPCSGTVKQLVNYKDRVLRHHGTKLQFDCNCEVGTFATFDGCYTEIETGIRIKSVESNSNLYFTTNDGIKKISGTLDSCCNTNFVTTACFITNAGGPKALDVNGILTYECGAFLSGLSKTAYRIVWGITDNNKTLILGSPSSRLIMTNSDCTTAANVCLTFSIPSDASTTCFFYQVYRTGLVTTCCIACVPCLEPGDEMNQVLEANLTAANITAGTITVKDCTPDSFRESGVLLYTNPVSGDGILQANEKPPIAKDVTTFRCSTFYANTQSLHNDTVNLLSVSCLTSGTSKFVVGNCTVDREYTFRGAKEIFTITTVANCTSSLNGDYVLMNSASNETKYFFWFESIACTSEPCAADTAGRIAVKVSLGACDTACVVACKLQTCVNAQFDFVATVCAAVITVTNAKNGNTTDSANGTTSPGFTFCVSTQGDGEESNTDGGGDVLLSSLTSAAQSIDETARSLVNIINRDKATKEVTTFSAVAKACLVAGDSFLFSGACDTNQFQFFYDLTGATCSPTCCQSGFTNTKIDITCDTTATQVATTTACVINTQTDFVSTSCAAVVTVTNAATGPSTDASDVAASTGYTFTVGTQGSKGGIVNAFYLSGEDDLPGIIRLEAKNLSDTEFFMGVQDDCKDITGQFSPKLDNSVAIACMACAPCTRIRITTCTAHGFAVNDFVYIYNTTNSVFGKEKVLAVPCTTKFDIAGTFTTTSTGRVFAANQISDNEVNQNRIFFSKSGRPEAVPLVNFLDVGGKDDPIERIIALRDNLFVLKTDGVFILTGGPAPAFSVRLLDNSVSIIAPDSAANLNNQIYMLSTQGVATVSDTGVGVISRKIEDKIFDVTGACFKHRTASFGVGYETDRSYILWLPTLCTDTVATQAYRFNTFNNSWVRWDAVDATSGLINSSDDKLYIGSGDSSFIRKERKTNDRKDFADNQSCVCIISQTITACTCVIELTSVSGIKVGDVVVQTQQLTVAKFNRLLRKLDGDACLTCTNYNCSAIATGACLACVLCTLVVKIDADDSCTCYTTPTGTTFTQIKNDYNVLVGELNCSAGTAFFNYPTITDTTEYEIVVTAVCGTTNKITVDQLRPLVAGTAIEFDGITSVIEWAPQHFGDPSILKQIAEGTLVLDGNNFVSGELAFSTDVSKDFDERTFSGRGVGFWGGFEWGESAWGGEGTDVPYRTLIPKQKQRCRYITVKFTHKNARELFSVLGISLNVRPFSTRAYRSV